MTTDATLDEQLIDAGAALAEIAARFDPDAGFDPDVLDAEQKMASLEAIELALQALERIDRPGDHLR